MFNMLIISWFGSCGFGRWCSRQGAGADSREVPLETRPQRWITSAVSGWLLCWKPESAQVGANAPCGLGHVGLGAVKTVGGELLERSSRQQDGIQQLACLGVAAQPAPEVGGLLRQDVSGE